MRRNLQTVRLCIIVGAMLNFAVAWYIAWRVASRYLTVDRVMYVRQENADGTKLEGEHERAIGTMYVSLSFNRVAYPTPSTNIESMQRFMPTLPRAFQREIQAWCGQVDAPNPSTNTIAIIGRGWPAASLYSVEEIDYKSRTQGLRSQFIDHGAFIFAFAKPQNDHRAPFEAIALPYYPLWDGMAINTAFYSIVAGVMLLFASIIRQWNRYRRGRCPRCAYDLRAHFAGGCSECGWRRLSVQQPGRAPR